MENKTIEALEKLIQIKDETIKELEKQIQLLKNQPPIVVPNLNPQPQTAPWYPNPIIGPGITPYPNNPLYPPYIVTSGPTTTDIKITSDTVLPPGSVQMNVPNQAVSSCPSARTSGYAQVDGKTTSFSDIQTSSNVTYINSTG